jgi:hypothetical protein
VKSGNGYAYKGGVRPMLRALSKMLRQQERELRELVR